MHGVNVVCVCVCVCVANRLVVVRRSKLRLHGRLPFKLRCRQSHVRRRRRERQCPRLPSQLRRSVVAQGEVRQQSFVVARRSRNRVHVVPGPVPIWQRRLRRRRSARLRLLVRLRPQSTFGRVVKVVRSHVVLQRVGGGSGVVAGLVDQSNCTTRLRVHLFLHLLDLYIGRSDVTESMVTMRSPFCGYNRT